MKVNFFRNRMFHFLFAVLFLGFGLAIFGTQAYAQQYRAQLGGMHGRAFPTEALRGKLDFVEYPYVVLDGKREMIHPGVRFIDTMNRTVSPAHISGKRQLVNYVRHRNGQLHTIWLLTANEAQEPRKGANNPKWWEKMYDAVEPWIDLAKWYGLRQAGL